MKNFKVSIIGVLMISLLFIFIKTSEAQNKKYQIATIAFYNLENLFDTIDTPGVRDTEFTPEGKAKWTGKRYYQKLDNMSEVISKIGSDVTKEAPAIIGVSEIENKQVLEDLVKTENLKKYDYHIVHYDSPDRRGIDVALLYRPEYFKFLNSASRRLTIKGKPDFKTRDQLVVSGLLNGEQIYLIVNHWPSRRGGEKRSRPLRNAAADLSRSIVDSIFNIDADAKIILMGDLNDDPVNESVRLHLKANGDISKLSKGQLYNTLKKFYDKGIGSLAYRDSWNLFDQIIISQSLLSKNTSSLEFYKSGIFNKNFLKQQKGRYQGYPFRTYAGGVYIGGYSDHFPTYIFLVKELK